MGSPRHARSLFAIATSEANMAALQDFCDAWSRYHVEKGLAAIRLGNKDKAAEHVHYADAWESIPRVLAEEVNE